MCLDSSDGEYGYVGICKECALQYFNNFDILPETVMCDGCREVQSNAGVVDFVGKFRIYKECIECQKYHERVGTDESYESNKKNDLENE